jgi:hypothetical protein
MKGACAISGNGPGGWPLYAPQEDARFGAIETHRNRPSRGTRAPERPVDSEESARNAPADSVTGCPHCP